jgi:VWFA-related protein
MGFVSLSFVMRNILLLLCLCVAPVIAQQSPGVASESADPGVPLLKVQSQFVMMDVLVSNRKTGNIVGNLKAEDFRVEEDGVPQTVSYFSRDRLPLSIVFLFDLTATVQPILKPLAASAKEILAHLKPEDEVSIMVFSSHTELVQDFTQDRALAAAAIEKAANMKTSDGTFIHEDMYEAVDQSMKSTTPESRRVLVWLTDGTSNLENAVTKKTIGKNAPDHLHSKQEATDKLLHSSVAVAALIDRSALTDTVVASMDATPFAFITGARVGDIANYAAMTGGPVMKTSKKEAAERMSELIDELRGTYTLGYKPASAKSTGGFVKLKVSLKPEAYRADNSLRESDVSVRAKRGYYP